MFARIAIYVTQLSMRLAHDRVRSARQKIVRLDREQIPAGLSTDCDRSQERDCLAPDAVSGAGPRSATPRASDRRSDILRMYHAMTSEERVACILWKLGFSQRCIGQQLGHAAADWARLFKALRQLRATGGSDGGAGSWQEGDVTRPADQSWAGSW